ncbi:MAG: alpha/beta hydrolase [Candidatus Ratteibacteria bacterium]|nr:alpha/beta hydrolase [Candidatus Ratteibacteria bacterium]
MNKKILIRLLWGKFSIRRLIRSVIFVYVCIFIFAVIWSDRRIFLPQPSSYEDLPEIIKLKMDDSSTISALHLVNPEAKYTVLYNHENAVDLGDIREFLDYYYSQGFSVFTYDYSGYGTSEGKSTSRNAEKNADTALKYLVEHKKIPLSRIIVHGRSVGGGPAVYLAYKYDVAGLIVESSFVTAFRVITQIPLFPFDKFRNIDLIDKVNCPMLVIHGKKDDMIPFWHGEKLFQKAKEPKMNCWLDNTTHNYMPFDAEVKYWAAISSFTELINSNQKDNSN